jgi:hypothetical protein
MNAQVESPKNEKPSFSHLVNGQWLIIVFGVLYIATLFLNWTAQRSFISFLSTGFAFMEFHISNASGLPLFFLLTLITIIVNLGWCFHFLKTQIRLHSHIFPRFKSVWPSWVCCLMLCSRLNCAPGRQKVSFYLEAG